MNVGRGWGAVGVWEKGEQGNGVVLEDGEELRGVGGVPGVEQVTVKGWRMRLIGRTVAELDGTKDGCDEGWDGCQSVVSMAYTSLGGRKTEELL